VTFFFFLWPVFRVSQAQPYWICPCAGGWRFSNFWLLCHYYGKWVTEWVIPHFFSIVSFLFFTCSTWKISILTLLCCLMTFSKEQSISRYNIITWFVSTLNSISHAISSNTFIHIHRLSPLFPRPYNLFKTILLWYILSAFFFFIDQLSVSRCYTLLFVYFFSWSNFITTQGCISCIIYFGPFVFAEVYRGKNRPWWKTSLDPTCNRKRLYGWGFL